MSSLSNVRKDKHLSIPLKVLPGSRHVCPAVYATETSIMLAFDITTWCHSIFPTTSCSASPIATPLSPVVVILTASDPTYTAVHCWRSCVSGGWKPPLEQSAARRHLSSNADCLPPQNLPFFLIISLLTVFGLLFCTPCIVAV